MKLGALDVDEFQRSTAQITGDPVRRVKAGDHAIGRVGGFLFARQDTHRNAEYGLRRLDEGQTVFSLAYRCRGQHVNFAGLGLAGKRAKPLQRGQGSFDAFLVHASCRAQATTKPAQILLVEKNGRRPVQSLVNHQSDRVRTDIDHGDGGNAGQTALCFGFSHLRIHCQSMCRMDRSCPGKGLKEWGWRLALRCHRQQHCR